MKTLREYIAEAEAKKVAIGHFNISNIEALHAIYAAAKELNVPVIIGVSEGERDFIGEAEAAALVHTLREDNDFPIFLNADHTYSFERVKRAIDAGFDAVIFDGVKLSPEENVTITKQCVEYARASGRDVIVEAELGNIGQSSKMLDAIPEGIGTEASLTKPEDAAAFVAATGVDLLAPAIGNLHGMLKNMPNPHLDIERTAAIRAAAGVPLVLHGGSGIPDEDFKAAIRAGVSVVHINTEIRVAFKEGLVKSLADNPDEVAPYKLLAPAVESVKKVVLERLKLFHDIA